MKLIEFLERVFHPEKSIQIGGDMAEETKIKPGKILSNRIRCTKCDDVIESETRHDLKMCKCGKVGVDGGKNYLRRLGNPREWEELSTFESTGS